MVPETVSPSPNGGKLSEPATNYYDYMLQRLEDETRDQEELKKQLQQLSPQQKPLVEFSDSTVFGTKQDEGTDVLKTCQSYPRKPLNRLKRYLRLPQNLMLTNFGIVPLQGQ